mmetsp:Transcript_39921/g.109864  ORF Transcript_39921/g.109864 Transcript_39921/m.109864 type:complete len:202 (+) Transcript_39921:106-711(+)
MSRPKLWFQKTSATWRGLRALARWTTNCAQRHEAKRTQQKRRLQSPQFGLSKHTLVAQARVTFRRLSCTKTTPAAQVVLAFHFRMCRRHTVVGAVACSTRRSGGKSSSTRFQPRRSCALMTGSPNHQWQRRAGTWGSLRSPSRHITRSVTLLVEDSSRKRQSTPCFRNTWKRCRRRVHWCIALTTAPFSTLRPPCLPRTWT